MRCADRFKFLCFLALLNEINWNFLSVKENEQLKNMYFLFL